MDKNLNMEKIINKIKNISLEEINKNLIFIAILSLLFRVGSFYSSHLPKPFESIVLIIIFIAIIDFIKNKKFKEFYYSFSKNIRISLICLVSSVLIGWGVSIIKGIPTTFNTILEFGTFMFSLVIFILIFFYTRNDKTYLKKYLYALFIPIVYMIFIIFPSFAYDLKVALGLHFVGFTTNPNIISKILLIPIIFFVVKTLFEEKNKWFKLTYFFISSLLVSLLFWTSSRGAILSLMLGMVFVGLLFSSNNFNWKKLIKNGILIILICLIGFILTPKGVKEVVVTRISNTEIINTQINNKPTFEIANNKLIAETIDGESKEFVLIKFNNTNELRLQIWSFYLGYILKNPLGIGPNTHINFYLIDNNGDYINSGPHNTYIQILFWGGIVAFLSFLYLLFVVFKNLILKLKSNFNIITFVLIGILFTLSLSIMFDDSLSSYWYFIILALSLRI